MSDLELEQMMEAKELPESDREQVRKFNEFLECRKAKKQIAPELRAFMLGEDVPAQPATT